MPLQATSGAASYDAFGGGVAAVPKYIEDYFSTFLYTGTGSAQTITNGIDLSTKGGLVWIKRRDSATNHQLADTVRGATKYIYSNLTDPEDTVSTRITSFNSDGFSLGSNVFVNNNTFPFASWSWAKAPKFFDVVTYTGTGSARTVAHNLGSVPGCIIVKRIDAAGYDWPVYHVSTGNTNRLLLNTTDPSGASTGFWNNTTPTSTVFTVGSNVNVNASGGSYVAYLFAHNAGGFGLTGTDNVISCGSFDANNGEVINLGYEPQWLLYKASSDVDNWRIADNMRGLTNLAGTNAQTIKQLRPNSSAVESENSGPVLTSTGFTWNQSGGGVTHIYIAIRRGPMKVPTSGTSVFAIDTRNATTPSFVSNFPVDMATYRAKSGSDWYLQSRMTINSLYTNLTAAENGIGAVGDITSYQYQTGWYSSGSSIPDLFSYMFRRAPSTHDEVCYTGTGAAMTVPHNLGVAPELIILKSRNNAESWMVYAAPLGNNKVLYLNSTFEADNAGLRWNDTTPTSSVFSVGKFSGTTPWSSGAGYTYVAYLFATCAGVSKVGSYTGTATTLQVDCGFTGGARFVLIKKTSGTGSWYVWDSARGIVSGNDPYLLLNSTAAEVTSTDYIDTYSAGFEISSTAPSEINENGGSFIFLAIS